MAQVHTLATLSLPRSLVWVDEFQWTAPLRAQEYSITGALIVDVATRQAGRPITLQGVADHGWMTRAALADLWALANTPEAAPLALTLADGRACAVRFADGNPIDPSPEAIDALLDVWPIFEAFQLTYVSKGLLLEQEKNASAPSLNGPSAGASATAKPAHPTRAASKPARTARRG